MATNRVSKSLSPPFIRREDSVFNRFARHFDWLLFSAVFFLSVVGLITIYSATSRFSHPALFMGKQFFALLIGLFLLFLLTILNYQIFSQHPRILFSISIFLLILVLLIGTRYRGTKAWLVLGPLSFQVSEISKLLTVLIVAGWCDKNMKEIEQIKSLLVPFLVVFSQVGLILLQPDFGSTLSYFPILLGILFVAGANSLHLFAIIFYSLVSMGIFLGHAVLSLSQEFIKNHPFWDYLYKAMSLGKEFVILQISLAFIFLFVWWFIKQLRFRVPTLYFFSIFFLLSLGWFSGSILTNSTKDYQRKRLVVFFKPGIDPLGSGYHVIQSVVAVGSGKIFGKGLFSGTQGRLGFLPEQHTDFIFSILAEELGFLVGGFVLLLYFFLVWRSIAIAGDSRDRFGSMIAVGIGSMFAFHIIFNLAMIMGLAPVTGLPLPFLSYGGSSLVSSLAAVGLLLSIHVRRYTR